MTPILHVSSIIESFAWSEKLGWKKGWDWGSSPTFGGICSDAGEIFLCQSAQAGRGYGGFPTTFGRVGDESSEKYVWKSLRVNEIGKVYSLEPEGHLVFHRYAVGHPRDIAPTSRRPRLPNDQ